MRRLIVSGVTALLALGLVACDRKSGSSRPAADDLGSNQPLVLGTSVAVEPDLDTPAAAHAVAAGVQVNGRLTVRTMRPGGVGRATNGGRVGLAVTVTLDAREPLLLDGQKTRRVVVPVETPNRLDFAFSLPPLAAGHHCLAIGVLEDAREYMEGRSAVDHMSMNAVDLTAGQGPDHCNAPAAADGPVNDDLPIGCDVPLMTNDPGRARYGGRFESGQPVWALVPSCAGARSVSLTLHHDGQLVTTGRHAPFSTPNDGHIRAVDLGHLPRGSWRIAVIASGDPSVAFAGPAVVID